MFNPLSSALGGFLFYIPFDIINLFYYILSMEQNPIEFIKEQDINWDRFYDILEEAYSMDVKRMNSLKDFDTWKEWKNK